MIEVEEEKYITGVHGSWKKTKDTDDHGIQMREQFIAFLMGWA